MATRIVTVLICASAVMAHGLGTLAGTTTQPLTADGTSTTAIVGQAEPAPRPRPRGGLIHPSQRTPDERKRLEDFRRRIDAMAAEIKQAETTGTTAPLSLSTSSTTTSPTMGIPEPQTAGTSAGIAPLVQ